MIQQKSRSLSSLSSSDLIYILEEVSGKSDQASRGLSKEIARELRLRGQLKEFKEIDFS